MGHPTVKRQALIRVVLVGVRSLTAERLQVLPAQAAAAHLRMVLVVPGPLVLAALAE